MTLMLLRFYTAPTSLISATAGFAPLRDCAERVGDDAPDARCGEKLFVFCRDTVR